MSSIGADARPNLFGSIEDFLDPRSPSHMPVPCVRLPPFFLEGLEGERIEIWAKLAFYNPLLQAKWYAAFGLLNGAKEDGQLKGVHTIDDNSSGNTALGYAVLGPMVFGIPNTVMTVPLDMPPSKLEILHLFRTRTERTMGGIQKSMEMGNQPGWFCPQQYHSAHNPDFFAATLGEQLWDQLGYRLCVLGAGLGTSGTITGTSRPFRERGRPNFTVVGVLPTIDQVPGTRGEERLGEIGFDWRKAIDGEPVKVTPKEAYRTSLQLCRNGILAGPSAGMALAGLAKYLKNTKIAGTLKELYNDEGEIVAAFICPDTLFPYLDKYTTHLEPEDLL